MCVSVHEAPYFSDPIQALLITAPPARLRLLRLASKVSLVVTAAPHPTPFPLSFDIQL